MADVILVTGATGKGGREVVAGLRDDGFRVHALSLRGREVARGEGREQVAGLPETHADGLLLR